MENWKDIPEYEGLYQVSDLGRVRSLDKVVIQKDGIARKMKGKILKSRQEVTQNRHYVDLYNNKKRKRFYVHSLVVLAFIGERPEGYDICHISGDNQDNRLANLRYDTKSQNQIDIYRQGGKHGLGKLSIKEVLEIRELYSTGTYTHKELAEMYSVSVNTTRRVVRRECFYWLNDDGTIQDSKTEIS